MGDRASDYEIYKRAEEAKGNVPDPYWLWGDEEHKAWLQKRQGGMNKKEAKQKTFGEKGRETRGSIMTRRQRQLESMRD